MNRTDDKRAKVNEQAFVSMLVHELRTPLTALSGSLGLLAEEVRDATPEVRSFAAIAARNAGPQVSILDDAAEYWRLNSPAALAHCEPTDMVDAVQRAIEQAQVLADEGGMVLDVRAVPAEASVDPALVRMAVARVLSYALRVSPKKATLQIRIETVDSAGAAGGPPAAEGPVQPPVDPGNAQDAVSRRSSRSKRGQAGASVVVSVSDGGRHIAADAAARLFEPFSAAARRGAEPMKPTGLGLAIALRIAELHQGSLVFHSTEQGGLFSLRLPVRRPRPRSPRRPRGKSLPE